MYNLFLSVFKLYYSTFAYLIIGYYLVKTPILFLQMGIRGGAKDYIVSKLIDIQNSGTARIHLSKFREKCIAIDWANISHRFLCRSNNLLQFRNEFINIIHKFAKYHIKIVFIFDGNPGVKKQQTLEYRKTARDKVLQKIVNIIENVSNPEEDFETIMHLSKRIKTITKSHVAECKQLFDILGVQYIHLENIEADCIFKLLIDKGIVDICFSGDMDLLAFGCQKIILDLDFKEDTVVEINTEQLLTYLNVSHIELLSAFILSGTDWNNGMKNSYFQHNLELIKKYNNIPNVIENLIEINNYTPAEKQITIPQRFDWQFSISVFTEILGSDIFEKIQTTLAKQTTKLEQIKNSDRLNILIEYGKSIQKDDSNYKYTRKYQEYIFWKYLVRVNLISYFGYK